MARDIDDGLQAFLRKAADHKLLSAEEERTLGRAVQRGDRAAKEKLIMSNIRLVVSVAREFRGRGLDFADVIQAGTIGLNRAVEKFDPDLGFRFTTYAMLWIKQAIQRELSKGGSAIRLPPLVADRRAKARALIAKYPDLPVEDIAEMMDMTVRHVQDALLAAEVITSLDRPAHDESASSSLVESMTDHDADDPQRVSDNAALYRALDTIPELDRMVVSMRFGLGDYTPTAVDAIGERTGLHRSKVNEILGLSMQRLKDVLD